MDKIKDSGSFDASSILAGTTKIQKSLTKSQALFLCKNVKFIFFFLYPVSFFDTCLLYFCRKVVTLSYNKKNKYYGKQIIKLHLAVRHHFK